MHASSQLRWRPQANTRRSTFSAWAMSIVFVTIAALSFAIDQTAVLSLSVGDDLEEAVGDFSPVRLIQSLIDATSDHSDHAN
jgi:hypothetical protein